MGNAIVLLCFRIALARWDQMNRTWEEKCKEEIPARQDRRCFPIKG